MIQHVGHIDNSRFAKTLQETPRTTWKVERQHGANKQCFITNQWLDFSTTSISDILWFQLVFTFRVPSICLSCMELQKCCWQASCFIGDFVAVWCELRYSVSVRVQACIDSVCQALTGKLAEEIARYFQMKYCERRGPVRRTD